MTDYTARKNETLRLFADATAFARKRNDTAAVTSLTETADRLSAERLFLIVCGEFKRGKSKLVNALLNEPLCPVDIDVTTAIVTTISYADTERVTVICGQPGADARPQIIPRADIPLYVTEQHNPANKKMVRLLAVETPNPLLKSGLVIVDTPGVGGLNTEHSDVTYAFLPNADVVLFVGDAQSPLAVKELEFAALTGKYCKHLIHAVTKVDGDAAFEAARVMATNRQKLANALNRPDWEIPVVGVSSNLKLEFHQSNDPQDLADSHFPELEAEIWKHLGDNRGVVLLGGALGRMIRVLGDHRAPIAAELEALEADSRKTLDELEARWQSLSDRLAELQSGNATWKTQLGDALEDLAATARDTLSTGYASLRADADQKLSDDEFSTDPNRLINRLQVEVNALSAQVTNDLRTGAERILNDIEASARLQLHAIEVGPIRAGGASLVAMEGATKTTMWSKALQMTNRATVMGGAGATLVALLGGAIGAAFGVLAGGVGVVPGAVLGSQLGALIGGVGGLATGARAAATQVSQQDRAMARKQLNPIIMRFLDDCQRAAIKDLTTALKNVQRAMRDDLTGQILAEKKVCEDTLATISQTRKLAPAEAAKRAAAVRNNLNAVDQLLHRAGAVFSQLSAPNTEVPTTQEPLGTPSTMLANQEAFGGWADG